MMTAGDAERCRLGRRPASAHTFTDRFEHPTKACVAEIADVSVPGDAPTALWIPLGVRTGVSNCLIVFVGIAGATGSPAGPHVSFGSCGGLGIVLLCQIDETVREIVRFVFCTPSSQNVMKVLTIRENWLILAETSRSI